MNHNACSVRLNRPLSAADILKGDACICCVCSPHDGCMLSTPSPEQQEGKKCEVCINGSVTVHGPERDFIAVCPACNGTKIHNPNFLPKI